MFRSLGNVSQVWIRQVQQPEGMPLSPCLELAYTTLVSTNVLSPSVLYRRYAGIGSEPTGPDGAPSSLRHPRVDSESNPRTTLLIMECICHRSLRAKPPPLALYAADLYASVLYSRHETHGGQRTEQSIEHRTVLSQIPHTTHSPISISQHTEQSMLSQTVYPAPVGL